MKLGAFIFISAFDDTPCFMHSTAPVIISIHA